MSDFDPTDIRAQEKREADKKEAQRFLSRQEADDFKWLMSDKRGRRFVWRLLKLTKCFNNPFKGNSESTAFSCGEMNVGLQFWADLHEHCPEKYNLMVTEQREYDRQQDKR